MSSDNRTSAYDPLTLTKRKSYEVSIQLSATTSATRSFNNSHHLADPVGAPRSAPIANENLCHSQTVHNRPDYLNGGQYHETSHNNNNNRIPLSNNHIENNNHTSNRNDISSDQTRSIERNDRGNNLTPPPNYHEIPGVVPSYQGRTSGPPPCYEDVINPNANPPSYQSLFGQVSEARKSSNGLVDLLRQLALIIIGTLGCTMIIGFLLIIPVTMIIVGFFYLNECRAENIPSFLVIGGLVWIVKNVLNCYNQFKKDSSIANRPPPRRTPISTSASRNISQAPVNNSINPSQDIRQVASENQTDSRLLMNQDVSSTSILMTTNANMSQMNSIDDHLNEDTDSAISADVRSRDINNNNSNNDSLTHSGDLHDSSTTLQVTQTQQLQHHQILPDESNNPLISNYEFIDRNNIQSIVNSNISTSSTIVPDIYNNNNNPTSSTTTTTIISSSNQQNTNIRQQQQNHHHSHRIRSPPIIGITSFKCESLLNYFLIVWFLAGCIIVYRIYEPDYNNPLSISYCHKTVYLYAFWLMTSAFIIVAIVLSCLCCLMVSSLVSCNQSR